MILSSLLARKLGNVQRILEEKGIDHEVKPTSQPRGSDKLTGDSRVLRVTEDPKGFLLLIAGNQEAPVYRMKKDA